jgi:hypothetical protein
MLDFIEQSPLHKNTYIILMGDNGLAVPKGVRNDPFNKLVSGAARPSFRSLHITALVSGIVLGCCCEASGYGSSTSA